MTNRFNVFGQIHKGLRAMLYDTALLLQHANCNSQESIDEVEARLTEVISLFEGHANTEDTMVFPIIQTYNPALVADFESQHQTDHFLGEALEDALDVFLQAEDTLQRKAAIKTLQQKFEAFLAFNISHMLKEETEINAVIWDNYTDGQLLELTAQIVQSIPPEKNVLYSKWMLIGNSDEEVIHWLQEVQHNAPPFVFDGLLNLAQSVLSPVRLANIQEALAMTSEIA